MNDNGRREKARESLYNKSIAVEAVDERQKFMAELLWQVFAEAVKGNALSHVVRLVQMRAYGNHRGTESLNETLRPVKKVGACYVHLDKVMYFTQTWKSLCDCFEC